MEESNMANTERASLNGADRVSGAPDKQGNTGPEAKTTDCNWNGSRANCNWNGDDSAKPLTIHIDDLFGNIAQR